MKTLNISLALLLTRAALVTSASAAGLSQADLVQEVAALVENRTLQAVSLGVLQPGGSTSAHAGSLAVDNTAPPDDATLYELGSVSKVFTALLLADTVARGELTLDTAIVALLPADVVLPDNAGDRITLGMLATHTSGLPRIPIEIPADNYTNPYAAYGEDELWETLRHVQLDFEPGTKAGYSNLAAGLLGTLLAHHADQSYAELLATRITQPLGMADTVLEPDDPLRARFAPPFTSSGEPGSHWDFQALAGAGGIRSTPADLMRFAAAMLHPEDTPLAQAIELGWAKQDLAATLMPGGQALGWMMAGDGETRWHNGMTGGYHAALFVNRQLGVATFVLANRSTPVGTQVAERLFRRAAGIPEQPIPNRDRAEIALTAEQIDRCTGTFRVNRDFALVLERRNLALVITPTGQAPDRLFAASPDTFFSRRVPAEIVFELPVEGGGPATALVLEQGGREIRAVRE